MYKIFILFYLMCFLSSKFYTHDLCRYFCYTTYTWDDISETMAGFENELVSGDQVCEICKQIYLSFIFSDLLFYWCLLRTYI